MDICKRELIRRHDGPYLDRLIVFGCDLFKVMIHRFLASDDECLHNHPWIFWSIILRGSYREWFVQNDRDHGARQWGKWYRAGSILFRRAEWAHRIEIVPRADPRAAAISLVITGPRIRDWGFFTKLGWIIWRDYKHAKHCA